MELVEFMQKIGKLHILAGSAIDMLPSDLDESVQQDLMKYTPEEAAQFLNEAIKEIEKTGTVETVNTVVKRHLLNGSAYALKDGTHNPEEIVTKTGVETNRVLDTLTSPILVSIPFTNVKPLIEGNTTCAAGTVWMYDPHLYPKNQVNTVVKRIITGGDANTAGDDGK